MILGSARAEDAEALATAHARGFAEPWSAAAIATLLEAPGGYGLAVWSDEAPRAALGFLLARAVAGEAEVLTLAVDPAARRRGLGRALVEAAAVAAEAWGAEALFLEVAADNAAALGLYAGAGFEPVGQRRGYYPRPDAGAVDALVLRRTLNRRAG